MLPGAQSVSMIAEYGKYTHNNWRIVSLSRSCSRRRGCVRVQLSLVHSTFLLLQDGVDPRARVIPKRINLCYTFGSEATQIRVMGREEIFSFLLQISNLCCVRESKRDEHRIFDYLLNVWTYQIQQLFYIIYVNVINMYTLVTPNKMNS